MLAVVSFHVDVLPSLPYNVCLIRVSALRYDIFSPVIESLRERQNRNPDSNIIACTFNLNMHIL